MVTVLVMGVAWFAVGALGRASVGATERETKTGLALKAAKQALLSHVAQYAARTDHDFPGRMPCPESLSSIGTANEGEASGSCSNTAAVIGRLPWRTLGVDEIRDGEGELLWYALSPNFHPTSFPLNAAPPNPYLNFGTPAELSFEGSNVVAVIIAPGLPLNGNACSTLNQQIDRYDSPLDPAKFFECGNATGSYTNPGSTTGTNDRAIAITAEEWIDAIAGPVADRLQRQVAPALEDWRTTESVASWGGEFMPYASTFSNHTTNDLCGDDDVREGLTPATFAASSTCTSWSGASVTQLDGDVDSSSCSQTGSGIQCTFYNVSSFWDPLRVRISANAPNVGGSFRAPIDLAAIDAPGATKSNFSLSLSTGSGQASLQFQLTYPWWSLGWKTITIPNLPDAAVLSDTRTAWFFNNDWGRHTYYVVSQGDRLSGAADCTAAGDPDCLTLNGLATSNASDKHFILALMGRGLAAIPQTQPSNSIAQYLESRVTSTSYTSTTVTSTFNDRLAACPFNYLDANSASVPIC